MKTALYGAIIGDICGYDLSRTLDEIRPNYYSIAACEGSVPEAIIAFLESENFPTNQLTTYHLT